MEWTSSDHLIGAFESYRLERAAFLEKPGCPGSNRDPLAEFSERLVKALIDGRLAESRVQKGYDVISSAGEKIQIKYLANPDNKWINEHRIEFSSHMDLYALVFFENLRLVAVLMFSRTGLEAVCQQLNKRHPDQHMVLQLT